MYGSNGDATIQVRFAANSDTGLIMAYYKGSSVVDTADPVAVTKSLSLFKSHVPQSPDILIVHWVNLANTSKNEL
jgi:hypothetical protein